MRGNPVRIRDCPAAVCRNDRRHHALGIAPGKRRPVGPVDVDRAACESEDLPTVSGTPCPTVHRLVEWASRPSPSCSRMLASPGSVRVLVRRWWPSLRIATGEHRDIHLHRDRAGLPAHRSEPRTQEGRRVLLGRPPRRRSDSTRSPATCAGRPGPSLRDAGLDSVPVNTFSYYDQVLDTAVDARRTARPGRRHRRRPRPLLRRRPRHRHGRPAGDDQVVRHQLPLPGAGDRPRRRRSPSTRRRCSRELEEAHALGIPARPVLIGPVTFLLLSKAVGSDAPLLDRLDELRPALCATCSVALADGGRRSGCRSTNPRWSPTAHRRRSPPRSGSTTGCRGARAPAGDPASRRTSATSATPCPRSRRPASRDRRSTWSPASDDRSPRCPSWPASTSSPVSSTDATSGAPTWTRPWPRSAPCWAAPVRSRSRRRARCCTSRTRSTRRPDSTTRCGRGWRSAPRRCARSSPSRTALTEGREAVADEFARARAAPSTRSDRSARLHDARVRARLDALTASDAGGAPAAERRAAQARAAAAAAADHHDRLLPADDADPRRARRAAQG